MNLRIIDGNGFVPAEAIESSRDSHETVTSPREILLNPPSDPALRAAWMDGYLSAVAIVAGRAQAQLDAALERRQA